MYLSIYVSIYMFIYIYIYSLDNSEWMRNGDYTPSRLGAQQDAGITLYIER